MRREKTCILVASVSLVFALLLVFLRPWHAEASWLIDPEKFHVSVHGPLSCHDCHEGSAARKPHPDPGNVNTNPRESFRLDRCAECHPDVPDDIEEGEHGGSKVEEREEFEKCLDCHDPHYQQALEPSGKEAGADKPGADSYGRAHESRPAMPESNSRDEACMGCHRSPAASDPWRAGKVAAFCLRCHDAGAPKRVSAEPTVEYPLLAVCVGSRFTHRKIPCTTCHLKSAQYPHAEQKLKDCRECHLPHEEEIAHDAHLRVSCEACHLKGVLPVKEAASGRILSQKDREQGRLRQEIHSMSWPGGQEPCRRCHFRGNLVGASAHVLPAKSILCAPCHAATFSIGDTATLLGLLAFCLGLASLAPVWISGTLEGQAGQGGWAKALALFRVFLGTLFSAKIFSILGTLFLDGLFQRRLLRQSRTRWYIHSLIFFPFVLRFLWGMSGLLASLWFPEYKLTWILLDKDHPTGSFLLDVTGLLVLTGVVLVVIRRVLTRPELRIPGLPRPDWAAYGLLAAVLVVGFVLEGMRIAMSGSPASARYAFVGFALSRLYGGSELTASYGAVWYLHAFLTAGFAAYLPFSRMFHLLMAPVSLALGAASRHGKDPRRAARSGASVQLKPSDSCPTNH